jgi:hypothetical protein
MAKEGVYAAFFREQAQWYDTESAGMVKEGEEA